ncbi:flavin reductase family protein [Microbacterium sp. B35-30]|uniref:flavin reductase family protein n=1 Tax=Microbacterium sp. B35-30 TaxID=1962642 RepID=UPI0013D6713D|nr:flavin reductase family protein [Microbacterium sp. B35-30]KAF2416292.1 flavin oxidoreductase [Microbacterium sp. B35-30]
MTAFPRASAADQHPSTRSIGSAISPAEFRSLFRGHPSGVAVITATGPDGPVALTASSVSSVSADPPLLVFSVSAISSATPTILAADSVVVHLLDADDIDLARLGATSGVDRFADAGSWAPLPTGEPVFRGVRAWVRGAVVSRMDAGGSTVIAAHAVQAHIARDAGTAAEGDALVFHNRAWHRLGEHSRVDHAHRPHPAEPNVRNRRP